MERKEVTSFSSFPSFLQENVRMICRLSDYPPTRFAVNVIFDLLGLQDGCIHLNERQSKALVQLYSLRVAISLPFLSSRRLQERLATYNGYGR